jgi:hypothetical protein
VSLSRMIGFFRWVSSAPLVVLLRTTDLPQSLANQKEALCASRSSQPRVIIVFSK